MFGDFDLDVDVEHSNKYEVIAVTHQHCYVCYLEFLQMQLQVQVQAQVPPALVTVKVSLRSTTVPSISHCWHSSSLSCMLAGIPTDATTGAGAGGTYTGDNKGVIEVY